MKYHPFKPAKAVLSSILLFIVLNFLMLNLYAQDLPAPAANLQLLPTGSYIIPMDNTLQANTAGRFNMKAYGLIVHLLNNGVKVKWVIKAGKLKDGIDFSANTNLVQPTSVTGDILRDFKAGPFVIDAADAAGVETLVTSFYSTNSLTGNDRPNLYVTAADVTVDVRYDLTGFVPMAAILNDGSNAIIHLNYMTASFVPSSNYAVTTGVNLAGSNFTFASEPHNTNTGAAVDAAITAIRNFVVGGGNFLAQCEGVTNYENNALGRFQTTTGVTVSNLVVGTTLTYPNGDLSYSQFEGIFNGSLGGTVRNWTIPGAGANDEHLHAFRVGGSTYISASVSKLKTGTGGLVFYLGNHAYTTTTVDNVNGMRMYMNALLTPAIAPSASSLPDHKVVLKGKANINFINLEWTATDNRPIEYFQLEQSNDASVFTKVATVPATQKRGKETYLYNLPNEHQDKKYYRIKTVYRNSTFQYGNVVSIISTVHSTSNRFTLLKNPVSQTIALALEAKREGVNEFSLYDVTGKKVYSENQKYVRGINNITIHLTSALQPGIYTLRVTDKSELTVFKIVKH